MKYEETIRELARTCAEHAGQRTEPTAGDYNALENKLGEWGIFGDQQTPYIDVFEEAYQTHATGNETEERAAE